MDLETALEKLRMDFDEFVRSVDSFFSPGMDKYNGYQTFRENFTADFSMENGFTGEPGEEDENDGAPEETAEQQFERAEKEAEEQFKAAVRAYRPLMLAYPGIEVRKVPAGQLGYGVLGRCFPYSGIIEIRQDLYGDEFTEVLTHELTHLHQPHLSELDVRVATRMKLPFTPRWH